LQRGQFRRAWVYPAAALADVSGCHPAQCARTSDGSTFPTSDTTRRAGSLRRGKPAPYVARPREKPPPSLTSLLNICTHFVRISWSGPGPHLFRQLRTWRFAARFGSGSLACEQETFDASTTLCFLRRGTKR
jgi:hypothetical protein